MKYIVKENNVIAIITNGNPNIEDLASRGEYVVESEDIINLPAKYIDGKIVYTDLIVEKTERDVVNELISDKIRELAVLELVKEGKITSDKKLIASK